MSSPTVEDAEARVRQAIELVAQLEQEWHDEAIPYERLAAARQALAFERSVVEARQKRAEKKAREAAEKEAEAQALADRREKARTTIKNLERTITAVENFNAATLDLHDACTNQGIKTLDAAFAATISTLRAEVKGPVAGDLNALQYQFRPPIGHLDQLRQQLEAAKTELAEASQERMASA